MAESNNTLERMFYEGGDVPKPSPNADHLRLYGHNLCPFVARARYTMSAKQVQFQEVMVDLNNKAQWHKDLNGGMVPVMETPQGTLIPESGIVAQYAMEANADKGIQLIPADPLESAKMRVKMVKFDKTLGELFGMVLSRGQNVEKIEAFRDGAMATYEQMAIEANGKFLFGTDELTLLDIHCGAMMECGFLMETGIYALVDEHLKMRENAPNWVAYMDRLRAHPSIKPYRMNARAIQAHGVRASTWDPNEKCQLSLTVLENVWPDED